MLVLRSSGAMTSYNVLYDDVQPFPTTFDVPGSP